MYTNKRNFIPAEEEYFSIDDILATNERIPCRFEVAVKKIGIFNNFYFDKKVVYFISSCIIFNSLYRFFF